MNLQFRPERRSAIIGLCVKDSLLLRQSGAFAGYGKTELLEGELWGVPRPGEDEPESDAVFPIKLREPDYELLSRTGTFDKYGKTELVDGLVYSMNPQFRPHGYVKDELAYRLRRALEAHGSPLRVATEQSVALSPHSQPQPDIVLTIEPKVKGRSPARRWRSSWKCPQPR